jgi:hypothetical protein
MFKPTKPMQRAKAILHRSLQPELALKLDPTHPELPVFIRPTPLVQIRAWVNDYGDDFWFWFVTPQECDGNKMEAIDKAWEAIHEILNLQLCDSFGIIDYDVMKAKQKAAEILLAKQGPMIAIQNNNNHSADNPKLPPGLARKTNYELEEMVKSKTRLIPQKNMCLEGEKCD